MIACARIAGAREMPAASMAEPEVRADTGWSGTCDAAPWRTGESGAVEMDTAVAETGTAVAVTVEAAVSERI